MKVLYIHQYFKTPQEGGSIRSHYLAKALVDAGHEVVMITAYNGTKKKHTDVDGIQVVYLPVSYDNKMTFKRRMLAFLQFSCWACMESMRQRNIDLCYVMTTPLTTGLVALFNKVFLRRPYIFEVGDLWPRVPIDMGLVTASWQKKILFGAEQLFYRQAKGLVGLSSPITEHLQAIAPQTLCQTVFNISNCTFFKPETKDPDLVKKYGVEDQLVISYTGTFGYANDLGEILNWMKAVADLPIRFLLVGDGAEKEKVRQIITSQAMGNVTLMDHVPKDQLREILNITDAVLISFLPVPSLHTGSPNKLFDGLAAGKLIITSFSGWIDELISKHECGGACATPEEFRAFITPFLSSKDKLNSYQRNARALAEAQFSLDIQSKKWLDLLTQLK